jgi:hypothetical protein
MIKAPGRPVAIALDHVQLPPATGDAIWLPDVLPQRLQMQGFESIQVIHTPQDVGPRSPSRATASRYDLPETLARAKSTDAPYRLFKTDSSDTSLAICQALELALTCKQCWWSTDAAQDADLVDRLDRPAGSSRHLLLLPAWGSQGSPALLLAIAFDTMPTSKPEIEAFAKSILTGVVNTLSLRRTRLVEQEDETFLAMQPHEIKTPLHHL